MSRLNCRLNCLNLRQRHSLHPSLALSSRIYARFLNRFLSLHSILLLFLIFTAKGATSGGLFLARAVPVSHTSYFQSWTKISSTSQKRCSSFTIIPWDPNTRELQLLRSELPMQVDDWLSFRLVWNCCTSLLVQFRCQRRWEWFKIGHVCAYKPKSNVFFRVFLKWRKVRTHGSHHSVLIFMRKKVSPILLLGNYYQEECSISGFDMCSSELLNSRCTLEIKGRLCVHGWHYFEIFVYISRTWSVHRLFQGYRWVRVVTKLRLFRHIV